MSDKVIRSGRFVGYRVPVYKVRLVKDGAARVLRREKIVGLGDAFEIFEPFFRGLAHEEIHIAFLDGRNQVRGVSRISQGGAHSSSIRPSDIFRAVLASGQTSFVLAHNHPSGDPTPSAADIFVTREIAQGAQLLDLFMLDHVVLAGGHICSHSEIMGEDYGVTPRD